MPIGTYGVQFAVEQRKKEVQLLTHYLSLFMVLGLLGLAIFSTERRTREIGIRKVLGATVLRIVLMLCKDVVLLILIALMIASPLAWYFMHGWLQGFAYRTTISGWMFIAAGTAAIGIALLTVGFQSMRAAMANPVKSLRTE